MPSFDTIVIGAGPNGLAASFKLASQGASDRVILSARRQGYMIADPSLFRAVPRPAANSNGVPLNGTEAFGAE